MKAADTKTHRFVFTCAFTLVLASFANLTWQRNTVFSTEETYWQDVVDKAPSSRSHVNLGRVLMARGDLEAARDHFIRALEFAPYWHVIHTNLAILYDATNQPELALQHHNEAVRHNRFTGASLSWRGEFFLAQGRYREALADFQASMEKSLEYYRNYRGMATASAGLGDGNSALEYTRQCLALDHLQTLQDIVSIVKPFFDEPSLAQAGIEYFRKLDTDLPDTWWIHQNIATLARRIGEEDLADTAEATAQRLRQAN